MGALSTFGQKQSSIALYKNIFDMFDKGGMPADTRWCSLILYLREMKDYTHYSDVQKARIQALLARVLQEKDFSEDRLHSILEEYKHITVEPYQQRIDNLFREANEILTNFQDLLNTRYGSIETLEKETIEAVEGEVRGEALLLRLRNAFADVKNLMENDISSLEKLATCDPLTDLANRRAFDSFMQSAVDEWRNEQRPLAIALFDIDYFKHFNDEHGHRIGDQVLQLVGKCLTKYADAVPGGNSVLAARYGGEEFALAVSGPDADHLPELAEKIRIAIRDYQFLIRDVEGNVVENALRITISAGVASCYPEWRGSWLENLVDSADRALYAAKQTGRDRTMRFDPTSRHSYRLVTLG